MSGDENDHLAWTKNPLLNIEKAIELQKLRRDAATFHALKCLKIMKQRITNNLTCSAPVLGRWVSDCDFPFIMETLLLSDRVFKQEFPGIKLSEEERRLFARELEEHSRACARCGAKRAEDAVWKARRP